MGYENDRDSARFKPGIALEHGNAIENQHDPKLEARIEAMELAFRMQMQAPEAFEVDKESEATKKLYGLDDEAKPRNGTSTVSYTGVIRSAERK